MAKTFSASITIFKEKKKDYELSEEGEAVKTFKSTWISWALKPGECDKAEDVDKGGAMAGVRPAFPLFPPTHQGGGPLFPTPRAGDQVWETYQQSTMESGKGNWCFD